MRPRIAVLLVVAVTVWVGWGLFIYHPAPNAMAPCVPNGQLVLLDRRRLPAWARCSRTAAGSRTRAATMRTLALDGLPPWDAFHPAVVSRRGVRLDMARFCGPVVCSIGGYSIFVFDFADGSRHAIGVVCAGVSPTCPAVQTYTSAFGS